MGWAGEAIEDGQVSAPGMTPDIMNLRYNADASALMAAELASDNRDRLTTVLGRTPDAAELYLGHFLGIGGATRFLSALTGDPSQSAAALLPKAAAANRGIFYGSGGARSVGEVMELMRSKVGRAMEDTGALGAASHWASASLHGYLPSAPALDLNAGPIEREFAAARQAQAQFGPQPSGSRSMADTLQGAFGLASGNGQGSAETPAFVRSAYDKLQRFNL